MDKTFEQEQRHLSEVYHKILELHRELTEEIEVHQKEAAKDLKSMSEELRPDVSGIEADEIMESLAAIETLNSVIDAYNQQRDFSLERMRRVLALLKQPYFAMVRLKMRPGRPARDVYIGTVGLTDNNHVPLVVDWRSPVAETYYKQENGPTSFSVDGKVRNVSLEVRRQFDIERNILRMYFDTTVAIEDSLLLGALKRHHSEQLQAITATIQREQNEVIRHDDVPALLVSGIAGSGKTSVLLQRIAYLYYQKRNSLDPEQIALLTPNEVFQSYIGSVLPSMGERNPQTYTWRTFMEHCGPKGRDAGERTDPQALADLEAMVCKVQVEEDDFSEVRIDGMVLLRTEQIRSAYEKFSQFPLGPRHIALTSDELRTRLERRLSQLARRQDMQEQMLALDVEEQLELFDNVISPENDRELVARTRTYLEHRFAAAADAISSCSWLRLDRLGSRMLGGRSLNAAEWLWLRLLVVGDGSKNTRYVMVDEAQDYTVAQLMVLARYYSHAHVMLLGDENQAIREGTASWQDMRELFAGADECALRTSYRSSPEITELFSSLLSEEERGTLSSVRRPGVAPHIAAFDDTEQYLAALREAIGRTAHEDGLCAIVADNGQRVSWLAKQLGDEVKVLRKHDTLPASGVVLTNLALAKGLEFDHVIIPDAQEDVYPNTQLARRRLYTAISRAMHQATVLAQGKLTPLLDPYLASVALTDKERS